jgi:tagaturonate reductase
MILSAYTLKNIDHPSVTVPEDSVLQLPEKVLQFGTGVLLRGLPDYFIDKANRQGIFNGRIVVIKSTSQGGTSEFEKQDGLYTVHVRGIEDGRKIEENLINSSISRVLSANDEWRQVLECAHDHNMCLVISNTTEVGIQLVKEDIRNSPPKSFPGKLLAFLYERFNAFGGSEQSGMVIIPTELIPDNGKKLESIVLELAYLNGLEDQFIEWLEKSNHFCSSLVDRIVPGRPGTEQQSEFENQLGYCDQLSIVSEAYRLWAIEGNETVREKLSFAQADAGVIIEENIDLYRELKLRLLNGTHTLSCGLAFLSGCRTVKEAMDDHQVSPFIAALMKNEIAPAIPYEVDPGVALRFADRVLDRFRNPHIQHQWINITMQYSSKMKMRCIPVLLRHYKKNQSAPEFFSLGFAAYLFFMKAVSKKGSQYYGEFNGSEYLIQDDAAEVFYKRWTALSISELVKQTLKDQNLWGTNLASLPGFEEAVFEKLNLIISHGMKEALEITRANRIAAA